MLALGEDRLDVVQRLAADAAVLLRQEIHGEVDAVEVAAGDRQVARLLGAAGSTTASYLRDQIVDRSRHADMDAAVEGDALGLHLLDAAVDVPLLHLEVGDAVAHQAAGLAFFS
jgi:hypothetical protein